MPVFSDLVSEKSYSVQRGTIQDHIDLFCDFFAVRFKGMQYTMRIANAMKRMFAILERYGVAEAQVNKTFSAARPSSITGLYNEFKSACDAEIALAIQYFEPLDDPESDDDYDTLVAAGKIVFADEGIARHLTAMARTKAESIYHMGSAHRHTPGPSALHSRALHSHVTNDDGLAFQWLTASSSTDPLPERLNILGYGVKSDSVSSGNSGYKWETK
ncbi:MAG: hypothetical protein AAFN94_14910 [Pseudomonadota bacterium]